MSWRKIQMKYPGNCIVCNERINANEVGLWAKDLGVKHEKCAQTEELDCVVCGGPAGCGTCEFHDDCDVARVSQLCICRGCSDAAGSFDSYQSAVKKRFRILNA